MNALQQQHSHHSVAPTITGYGIPAVTLTPSEGPLSFESVDLTTLYELLSPPSTEPTQEEIEEIQRVLTDLSGEVRGSPRNSPVKSSPQKSPVKKRSRSTPRKRKLTELEIRKKMITEFSNLTTYACRADAPEHHQRSIASAFLYSALIDLSNLTDAPGEKNLVMVEFIDTETGIACAARYDVFCEKTLKKTLCSPGLDGSGGRTDLMYVFATLAIPQETNLWKRVENAVITRIYGLRFTAEGPEHNSYYTLCPAKESEGLEFLKQRETDLQKCRLILHLEYQCELESSVGKLQMAQERLKKKVKVLRGNQTVQLTPTPDTETTKIPTFLPH
jgi:hypothetical protein